MRDARDKHDKNLPPEYRVEAFLKQFPAMVRSNHRPVFVLTSHRFRLVRAWKATFCHEHRIDLDGEMTLDEFLQYSLGNYGR